MIDIIVATDRNFGIGHENKLPWPKNEKDMKWFRDQTRGHVIVMGRKTWESIGSKPLPNRINVVITSKEIENAHKTMSGDMGEILKSLEKEYPNLHIWVIGGSEIYSQSVPYADNLYHTTIIGNYECDAFVEKDLMTKFPVIRHWKEEPDIIFQIRSKK